MANVKQLLTKLEKDLGRKLGSVESDDPPRLPSGIFPADIAMGGGFPMGRVSVVYGPESSMKTTLALKAIASAQRLMPKRSAVFFDAEGRFSPQWAAKVGVDLKKLVYLLPSTAEECVNMAEDMLYAEDVSVIVVDSLAAFVTGRELDSKAEDSLVGTAGLLISKFYRRTTAALVKARQQGALPTLIAINQVRSKMGVSYGDPDIMPGGWSFKFASSLTLKMWAKDVVDKSVSKSLPAFKEIHFGIRKWSVPVVSSKAEFLIALLDNPKEGLRVGDVPEIKTIMQYLRGTKLVVKDSKRGWVVDLGEEEAEFRKEEELREALRADLGFRSDVRNRIIAVVLERGDTIGIGQDSELDEE